jgi:hypothetical protein
MRALAVLAFFLISSTSFAATSERFSRGGVVQGFPARDRARQFQRRTVRIKGHCQSNCTLFLGLRNVCVERSATLLFHAGHDRQRNIHAGSTQRMLSAYNAKLRNISSTTTTWRRWNFTPFRAARSSTGSATGNVRASRSSQFHDRKCALVPAFGLGIRPAEGLIVGPDGRGFARSPSNAPAPAHHPDRSVAGLQPLCPKKRLRTSAPAC